MSEPDMKYYRAAVEARDMIDLDALMVALERQGQDVVEMAGHYMTTDQHPQGPHIFTYLHAAGSAMAQALQMLGMARTWIPLDEPDPTAGTREGAGNAN